MPTLYPYSYGSKHYGNGGGDDDQAFFGEDFHKQMKMALEIRLGRLLFEIAARLYCEMVKLING